MHRDHLYGNGLYCAQRQATEEQMNRTAKKQERGGGFSGINTELLLSSLPYMRQKEFAMIPLERSELPFYTDFSTPCVPEKKWFQ
ncbi:hypothetical protein R1flu_023511 [Riccia fluitans]|uniref:Uncharacterized protein n=1 Tax=Riccia fluitans TaxID=41844 RepID=A0ABD1XSS3_9MARC